MIWAQQFYENSYLNNVLKFPMVTDVPYSDILVVSLWDCIRNPTNSDYSELTPAPREDTSSDTKLTSVTPLSL